MSYPEKYADSGVFASASHRSHRLQTLQPVWVEAERLRLLLREVSHSRWQPRELGCVQQSALRRSHDYGRHDGDGHGRAVAGGDGVTVP